MIAAEGHAWIANDFGEPTDVLAFTPRTWEEPPEGALLVKVSAVGVGLPDLLMTKGAYPLVRKPPVTPGQEVCGVVVATATGSRFRPGDRVFGPTRFYAGSGGFASHVLLTDGHATLAPESMSDEDAAGFYIGYRTAHAALVTRAQVVPGESVLVLGGSGGTGATAISLAKALGARVVAVASSDEKREFCLSLGADAAVDRTEAAIADTAAAHTGGKGFDVVIDPVGGEIAASAMKSIARYGRFAAIGFASGSWAPVDVADAARRNYSVVGVLAAGFTQLENEAHLAELCGLAEAGEIATPIGRIAGLADVPAVLSSLASAAPPGKTVVTVSGR